MAVNQETGVVNDRKTKHYRRAAEAAAEQLDWCVSYLRSNGRTQIARFIARNRDNIRRQLSQAGSDRTAEAKTRRLRS